MRVLALAVCMTFVIGGIAFATPIPIQPANVTSNYNNAGYMPAKAVDGIITYADEWVGGLGGLTAGMPWLQIDLGQLYNVDSATIFGFGSSGMTTSFDIFVGTLSALQNIETNGAGAAGAGATNILTVTNQQDGGEGWHYTAPVSPSTQTQYVLYEATGTPNGNGQDAAFATNIAVDAVPEPATLGLIGFGLLALGFVRRSRQ
jgi:hypothetical protein